jgi:signal peptidase I
MRRRDRSWCIGLGVALSVAACEHRRTIPSSSMFPTLRAGESFPYAPVAREEMTRGALVIFRSTGHSSAEYVKRVVAVEGDHVTIDGAGQVTVNGTGLAQCTVGSASDPNARGPDAPVTWAVETNGPRRYLVLLPPHDANAGTPLATGACAAERGGCDVPPRTLYLLGDNRPNSYDSREIGFVGVDAVVARVMSHDEVDRARVPEALRAGLEACLR